MPVAHDYMNNSSSFFFSSFFCEFSDTIIVTIISKIRLLKSPEYFTKNLIGGGRVG